MAENGFSFNMPTSILPGSSGTMAANFDFGPNTATIAQNAFSFLNTTFASNQNFFNHGVDSTNAFIGGFVNPLTSAAATTSNTVSAMLPDLMQQETQLASNAMQSSAHIYLRSIGAQQQVANASIGASKKASGGGGFCFITTAVCGGLGLKDDCEILTKLRAFRDSFMADFLTGRVLISTYYRIAPGIVADMERAPEKVRRIFYRHLLHRYLIPAVCAIDSGQNFKALEIYARMVAYASRVAHEYR